MFSAKALLLAIDARCSGSFNVIKQPSGSTLQCTIQCRDISSTARRKTQQGALEVPSIV